MAIGAGAAGAWAAVTSTAQVVTLPAHATGDLLVLIVAGKAATMSSLNPTTSTTGWLNIASFADGTTASGTGVGSVRQTVFYKVATSGAEGNPTIAFATTTTPSIAVALCFTKGSGETWYKPEVVQAATNAATSISVTMGSNPGIVAGDSGVVAHTTRDDSALTVPTWTATGATLGTATVFPTTPIATTTSDDMAGTVAYRSVTSGTASAAPVVTGTQAAAETGVTSFIRLRVATTPAGTTIYPTDTASAVSTASTDYEAWTTAGASATFATATLVTGPTSPIQLTHGGGVVDWFTRPLAAFSLSSPVLVDGRVHSPGGDASNVALVYEIARVDGDGTNPMVWSTVTTGEVRAGPVRDALVLDGSSLSVANGQRLRIRFYADDSSMVMVTGSTVRVYFNGATETAVTFTQTLTEYSAGPTTHEAAAAVTGTATITLATAVRVAGVAASISGAATVAPTASGPVTISFVCGAESTTEFAYPNWDVYTPNSGAVTKDTTHVRSGTYAIKITADANLQQEIPASKRVFAMRLAVWAGVAPSVLTRLVEVNDGGNQRLLSLATSGKLQWYDGTNSTLNLPTGQWNTVDLLIDSRSNPHAFSWKVNGVAQTGGSSADAASDFVRFFLGSGSSSAGARWIDDLALSYDVTDYPIPNGSVTWTGSVEVWTPAVATTHEAAAAITATATVAPTASVSQAAAATVSGTATVTAAGAQRVAGVASTISGAATVTAGASASQAAASAVTGTATVAAIAQRVAHAAADISAVATITGDATITAGAVTHEAAAAITSTATVAADASQAHGAAAAILGLATVAPAATATLGAATAISSTATVSAALVQHTAVAAAITGTATITAAGALRLLGASTAVTGTATVAPGATAQRAAASSVSGAATVSAAASSSQAVAAAITSTATVAAGAQRVAQATTAITGTTTVTAGATALYAVAAAVTGVATQSATASVLGAPVIHDALGPISATATVTGTVTASVAAATSISGLATVSAGASLARPLASGVMGQATTAAGATVKRAAAAAVTGVATVSVAAQNTKPVAGAITGTATVTGAIYLAGGARAIVSASAVVSADATAYLRVLGALQGIATASGTAERVGGLSASINGVATVLATLVNTLPQPFPPGFGISVGLVPIGGAVVGMVPLPTGGIYLEPIGTAVVGLPAEEAAVILEPLAPVEVGMA